MRFFTNRVRGRWLLLAAATAVSAMALIATASGILTGSPSSFEANDGNMVVAAASTNNDWSTVDFDEVEDPGASNLDDSFTSGQKQDTACPEVSPHKNPPKDDFTNVASFSETNTTTLDTFLYGATIRYAANGNASENVELKQGTEGTCAGSDLLERVAGDKLIAIDYLNGGTNVQFNVLTWVDSGACFVGSHSAPCWGATVQSLAANQAEGLASQSPITAANNPISGTALATGQFAEFGINLTDSEIIPEGECVAFPQTVWGSRASGSSFVSTTKDIAIENVTISNCGEITIIKQTDPRGIDQNFEFGSDLPENADAGGVPCEVNGDSGVLADGSFCLNDDGNDGKTLGSTQPAQNSTGNTMAQANVLPGTYTITEGDDPTGFSFDDVTCTPDDDVTIDGKEVTIDLGLNDSVVCVYENDQQEGAIQVSKISSKASEDPLAGAHFQICTNDGPYDAQNECDPAATGSDDLVTDDDGLACIDGLGFGDYYVTETQAPDGHAIDDDSANKVTVDGNAACDDTVYAGETITFEDTPLTDLTVHVESQATGGTASRVECVDSATPANQIGDSPQPPDVGGNEQFADPVDLSAEDLKPGTYTCTVVVDP